eukprot:PhM_4_TR750/c1_g1_i3/m.95626
MSVVDEYAQNSQIFKSLVDASPISSYDDAVHDVTLLPEYTSVHVVIGARGLHFASVTSFAVVREVDYSDFVELKINRAEISPTVAIKFWRFEDSKAVTRFSVSMGMPGMPCRTSLSVSQRGSVSFSPTSSTTQGMQQQQHKKDGKEDEDEEELFALEFTSVEALDRFVHITLPLAQFVSPDIDVAEVGSREADIVLRKSFIVNARRSIFSPNKRASVAAASPRGPTRGAHSPRRGSIMASDSPGPRDGTTIVEVVPRVVALEQSPREAPSSSTTTCADMRREADLVVAEQANSPQKERYDDVHYINAVVRTLHGLKGLHGDGVERHALNMMACEDAAEASAPWMGGPQRQTLARLRVRDPTLTTVDFTRANLSPSAFMELLPTLEGCPFIQELYFDGNPNLGDEALQSLAARVLSSGTGRTTVVVLSMCDCPRVSDAGVRGLLRLLHGKNAVLREVRLHKGTSVSSGCLRELASFLYLNVVAAVL